MIFFDNCCINTDKKSDLSIIVRANVIQSVPKSNWKMEKSIRLIRIPLNITGFDILKDSCTFWHSLRRWIFFVAIVNLCYCFIHTMFFEERFEFCDKILLSTSLLVYVSISIQGYLFWAGRKKLVMIIDMIRVLHFTREEAWINDYSWPLIQKCAQICFKMCK